MHQFNNVVLELKKQYDRYKIARQRFFRSTSRDKRDYDFEMLLNKFQKEKISDENNEKFLEEICNFYKKHKNSGGFRSEPELIKYIRQALYSIFGVNHSQPKTTRYGVASIIRYNSPTPETDYSIKKLHGEIKGFLDYMKQDQSEGIRLGCLKV